MTRRSLLRSFLVAFLVFSLTNLQVSAQRPDVGGKRGVDVATANLYVGADFGPVTLLDPTDPDYGAKLLAGVAAIYGGIVASNFPLRAAGFAQEIASRHPDLVALQEVSLIRRQHPGDAIAMGTTPALDVEMDYLAILLEALGQQGLQYEVVSMVEETDVEVPIFTGTGFDDLRLTDRDVILKRSDIPPGQLRVSNPQAGKFAAYLPLPTGLNIERGWCSVDVQVRGRWFRFINAHLELPLPPPLPDIQAGQALELLAGPANTLMPVMLVGDFNSDAYGNYGPTVYPLLTGLGQLDDAWSVSHPNELGLTWGHDEFLSNPSIPFSLRLDLVLFRGNFGVTNIEVADPVIGMAPPFWPSDHGSVFASFAIP